MSEAQQNGGMPSWDTWINQMTHDQREYEKYRVIYALHSRQCILENRIASLENDRRPRHFRDLGIHAGSAFLGGMASVYTFLYMFNPFQ